MTNLLKTFHFLSIHRLPFLSPALNLASFPENLSHLSCRDSLTNRCKIKVWHSCSDSPSAWKSYSKSTEMGITLYCSISFSGCFSAIWSCDLWLKLMNTYSHLPQGCLDVLEPPVCGIGKLQTLDPQDQYPDLSCREGWEEQEDFCLLDGRNRL